MLSRNQQSIARPTTVAFLGPVASKRRNKQGEYFLPQSSSQLDYLELFA